MTRKYIAAWKPSDVIVLVTLIFVTSFRATIPDYLLNNDESSSISQCYHTRVTSYCFKEQFRSSIKRRNNIIAN